MKKFAYTKKILFIMLLIITFIVPNSVTADTQCYDIDGDGRTSAADARLALRASVKLTQLTPTQFIAADTDNDDKITASDARTILRACVGLNICVDKIIAMNQPEEQVLSSFGIADITEIETVDNKRIISYIYESPLTVIQVYDGTVCGLLTFDKSLQFDLFSEKHTIDTIENAITSNPKIKETYNVYIFKDNHNTTSPYAVYITTIRYEFSRMNNYSTQIILSRLYTNALRDIYGVPPLSHSDALSSIAESHSKDMVSRQYFSHTTPEGLLLGDRYSVENYDYSFAGENIYRGNNNIFTCVDDFYNSPPHRKTLLSEYYTKMGTGFAKSIALTVVTQNFSD